MRKNEIGRRRPVLASLNVAEPQDSRQLSSSSSTRRESTLPQYQNGTGLAAIGADHVVIYKFGDTQNDQHNVA